MIPAKPATQFSCTGSRLVPGNVRWREKPKDVHALIKVLVFVLLSSQLIGAKPRPTLLSQDQMRWKVAMLSMDGEGYVLRVAENVAPLIKAKALNDTVGLAIPFQHDGDKSELDGLNRFEDLVLKQCCSGQDQRLVVVLTGKSMREFVFQSRNGAVLVRRLKNMAEYAGGHELQTYVKADPTWDTWRAFGSKSAKK